MFSFVLGALAGFTKAIHAVLVFVCFQEKHQRLASQNFNLMLNQKIRLVEAMISINVEALE